MRYDRGCWTWWFSAGALLLLAAVLTAGPEAGAAEPVSDAAVERMERNVPQPLPGHPGNVFLAGEAVEIPSPPDSAWTQFRVLDDAGETQGGGARENGATQVAAGTLPAGWYRIEFLDAGGKAVAQTSAAVLVPLTAPIPLDSPICIDTAMAWFARRDAEKQRAFASLAALAGMNWSRDRLSWGELETEPGVFAQDGTSYDTAASAAAAEGLNVLQVFHHTPPWAQNVELDSTRPGGRFPRDLRALYRLCEALAIRYQGRVQAWEPWNEANITSFGGHLINEMCSFQKAAFLAFKAGDPELTVCWNVYAGSGSALHTEGVLLNEAWPYFDTYNIHTYSAPANYLAEFEGPRNAASGKPIWLTECGIRLKAADPEPEAEMSEEDELQQAWFVAPSYASSLYSGVERHFFFILGNYFERGIQFGLLRHDLTPRPGYVALASVGRLLASARPLGRHCIDAEANAWAYAFHARPEGRPAEVLVAWADTAFSWQPVFARAPVAVHDYLGRALADEAALELGPAAVFVVLPEGTCGQLALEPPPPLAMLREGTPSPVVLQAEFPQETVRLEPQAYELTAGEPAAMPLWVYNFSAEPVEGRLAVDRAPADWRVELPGGLIQIPPFEGIPLMLDLALPTNGRPALVGEWVHIRGDFGAAGQPVLAFRLIGERGSLAPLSVHAIEAAADPARWEENIVEGASMVHQVAEDGAQVFTMQFGDGEPWSYPRLRLEPAERPSDDDDGLAVTVDLIEGEGSVNAQFIEESGATYVARLGAPSAGDGPQRVMALFSEARWASYSRPDPNGRLDPGQISIILIGLSSRRNTRAELALADPAWVRY
ncbi:MAG: hypothetical protein ACOX5J_12265 [Candidatus Hydrogenedentales bacterium]|jgi:hypothetical protein